MAYNSEIPFEADFEVTVVDLTNDLIAKIETSWLNILTKMDGQSPPVDMRNLNRDLKHLFSVARYSAKLLAREE